MYKELLFLFVSIIFFRKCLYPQRRGWNLWGINLCLFIKSWQKFFHKILLKMSVFSMTFKTVNSAIAQIGAIWSSYMICMIVLFLNWLIRCMQVYICVAFYRHLLDNKYILTYAHLLEVKMFSFSTPHFLFAFNWIISVSLLSDFTVIYYFFLLFPLCQKCSLCFLFLFPVLCPSSFPVLALFPYRQNTLAMAANSCFVSGEISFCQSPLLLLLLLTPVTTLSSSCPTRIGHCPAIRVSGRWSTISSQHFKLFGTRFLLAFAFYLFFRCHGPDKWCMVLGWTK